MRRQALIAGCGAALLALSGCAVFRPRDRTDAYVSQSPQVQALSQNAQAAIDRHDYESARVDLVNLVSQVPRSAEAHHRLGRVLQLQGRLEEAAAAYHRALELDREYVGALIGLGQIEAQLGQADSALQRFELAIEIDPNQSEAHFSQGRVFEAVGRFDDALSAYFRALELDTGSVAIGLRVATLQLARHQTEQALARLDQILESSPDDPEAHHQRGLAYLALKHPAQAVTDLQFAAKRFPRRADVLYHLALAYDGDHKTKQALDAAEGALKLAPGFAEAKALTAKLRR